MHSQPCKHPCQLLPGKWPRLQHHKIRLNRLPIAYASGDDLQMRVQSSKFRIKLNAVWVQAAATSFICVTIFYAANMQDSFPRVLMPFFFQVLLKFQKKRSP